MIQFLSTLLGAFLATLGGIIGSIVTFQLAKRSETRSDKKTAYLNLLSLCEKVINLDIADKATFMDELAKTRAYISLYGNADVKKAYNRFYNIVVKEHNNPKSKDLLHSQVTLMASTMKCDLGIATKKEKEIVKKLRKEENQNAD